MSFLTASSTGMKSLIKLIIVWNYFSGKIKYCVKWNLLKKLVTVLEFCRFVLEMSWICFIKLSGHPGRCFVTTVFWKYAIHLQENTHPEVWCQKNFIEITLRHGCSAVNLLYIFRAPFRKNTSGGLLLSTSTEDSTLINEFYEETSFAC